MTDADVIIYFRVLIAIAALIVLCTYAPRWPARRKYREIHEEEVETAREIGASIGPASYTYTEYGVERTVRRGTEEYNQIAKALERR